MTAKLKTYPFDSAEFLDTEEGIAAYLSDALASGSSAEFQDALGVVARARGMTEIAKSAGLGRENLYNTLRPNAHPRFDTVQRVLGALGVALTIEPKQLTAKTKSSGKSVYVDLPGDQVVIHVPTPEKTEHSRAVRDSGTGRFVDRPQKPVSRATKRPSR